MSSSSVGWGIQTEVRIERADETREPSSDRCEGRGRAWEGVRLGESRPCVRVDVDGVVKTSSLGLGLKIGVVEEPGLSECCLSGLGPLPGEVMRSVRRVLCGVEGVASSLALSATRNNSASSLEGNENTSSSSSERFLSLPVSLAPLETFAVFVSAPERAVV